MPTYEYECPNGHRFELFQRMSDEPVSECPECGARAQRKISGGAGFLFKGDGFYITDYRSDDYKKKASAEQPSSSSSSDDKGGGAKKGGDAKSGDAKSKTDSGSGASKTSSTPSDS
jgi:putative FmdB family regulatory protein